MYSKGKGSTVPSDNQSREKLALYVYEYLIHIGAQKAAQTFLQEIRWEKAITLAEPPGFLHSWWSVFWDLYSAAPERRDTFEHSSEAKAFHDYGFVNSGFPNGIGHPQGPPVVSMAGNNMEMRPGHPMGPGMHQRLPHPGSRMPHGGPPPPPMGPGGMPYGLPGGIRPGAPPMNMSGGQPPPRMGGPGWMPPSSTQYSSASPVTYNGPQPGPGTPGNVMSGPQGDPNMPGGPLSDPYGPPGGGGPRQGMPPGMSGHPGGYQGMHPGPGPGSAGPCDMPPGSSAPSQMMNGGGMDAVAHMEGMKNSPAGSGSHMVGGGGTPRDDMMGGPPPPPSSIAASMSGGDSYGMMGGPGPMMYSDSGGMCMQPGPPHMTHPSHGMIPHSHPMNGPMSGHPVYGMGEGGPMMMGGDMSPGPHGGMPPGDPNFMLMFSNQGGPPGSGSPGPGGGPYMPPGPPNHPSQGGPPPDDFNPGGMMMNRRK